MYVRTSATLAFAVATFASLSGAGAASGVTWSMTAAGCTPAPATIDASKYAHVTIDGGVGFDAGAISTSPPAGPIVLICPITNAPVGNQLTMVYRDSSGAASTASVKAELIAIPLIGPPPRTVVATINSDTFNLTGTSSLAACIGTLDFDTNFYHVRVEIARTAGNLTTRLYGLYIDTTICT